MAENEATREALYLRCLALRETALQTERTHALELAVLQSRVRTAYRFLIDRGRRRAERDPAYAMIREWAQGRVADEGADDDGLGGFETLTGEDFHEMIEAAPSYAARLRDLAHEFGVNLRPESPADAPEDRPVEKPQPAAEPPPPPAWEPVWEARRVPPVWDKVRKAMGRVGIEPATIERVIREARGQAPGPSAGAGLPPDDDGPPHGDDSSGDG